MTLAQDICFPIMARKESIFSYTSSDLDIQPYFYKSFGKIPHTFTSDRVHKDFIHEIIKFKHECVYESKYSSVLGISVNSRILKLAKNKVVIKYGIYYDDFYNVTVYHTADENSKKFVDIVNKFYTPHKEEENPISLMVEVGGRLTTMDYKIKSHPIDIPVYYGDQFSKVYDLVFNELNEKKRGGLILFHGTPGTGKTTMIKHIAKQLKRRVIFMPPNMGNSLSSPSFLPFLLENKDCVLVIEDAEDIISERASNRNSAGVSNILNVTDGILGDCLNIHIICTFNVNRSNIDKALLRKGRLIAEYEFNKLTIPESNRLINHLGLDYVAHSPMSVADIFGITKTQYTSDKKEKIGFKV